jgi:hypothetical protein
LQSITLQKRWQEKTLTFRIIVVYPMRYVDTHMGICVFCPEPRNAGRL